MNSFTFFFQSLFPFLAHIWYYTHRISYENQLIFLSIKGRSLMLVPAKNTESGHSRKFVLAKVSSFKVNSRVIRGLGARLTFFKLFVF